MTPLCTTLLTDIQSAGVAYVSVGAMLTLTATLLCVWAIMRWKNDQLQFGTVMVAAIVGAGGMAIALVYIGDATGPSDTLTFLKQCGR